MQVAENKLVVAKGAGHAVVPLEHALGVADGTPTQGVPKLTGAVTVQLQVFNISPKAINKAKGQQLRIKEARATIFLDSMRYFCEGLSSGRYFA